MATIKLYKSAVRLQRNYKDCVFCTNHNTITEKTGESTAENTLRQFEEYLDTVNPELQCFIR